MIAAVAALAVLGFFLSAPVGVAALLTPASARPRPPRHARPKDYQGPPNRAPFPVVAGQIPDDVAISARLVEKFGPPLSPLSTDVLRNMFRRDMAEKHGRRLV